MRKLWLLSLLLLIGCRSRDTFSYEVRSVKILTGNESHVSDGDTYIIGAEGVHSVIRAEGYNYIEVGDVLCAVHGLLFEKKDPNKPCFGNVDLNGPFFKIALESSK